MKVFFFDIDGTLFDRQRGVDEIPQTTVDQLERLHEAGHKLFVCSGRPFTMIEESTRLPVFDGYVACNGAQVEIGGETIFTDRLEPGIARMAANLFERLGCDYMVETPHHVYIDPARSKGLYEFFLHFMPPEFFTCEFDLDEVCGRAIKVEASVLDPDYQAVIDAIEGTAGFVAVADRHGTDHAFEIYSPTLSKAVGIAKVLEHYGLGKDDAIGVGDGTNDIEMFRACGLGVAMGNSSDEVKAEADLTIGNVEDDGLARWLATIA